MEDLTVDATVCGSITDVETYDRTGREYLATDFRQPQISALYCGNCGEYLFEGGLPSEGIDSVVRQHLGGKNEK
jgi:hypothetical protein